MFGLEAIELLLQRGARRLLFFGQRGRFPAQTAQAIGVAVREIGRDRDPFPAFGGQAFRLCLKLLVHKPIEKRRILQPAAVIVLEQVAGDVPAGRLIGLDADELRAPVAGITAVSVSRRRI